MKPVAEPTAAPVELRDGSRVLLRPIVPDDGPLLLEAFERLGPESRYRRFLAPVDRLTPAQVRYLVDVDHHDHEALVALDADTGGGVGVARYVREAGRPDAAEAAVTIIDDWQGRGLGTLLLELLAGRAQQEGIDRFTAVLLATNEDMIDMLGRVGIVTVTDRAIGTIEVEVELRPEGLSPRLRGLLRAARASQAQAPRRARPKRAPRGRAPDRGR